MLVSLYAVALVAAVAYGIRVGNRQFVMPKSRNMVALSLAFCGLLALVPTIFYAFDWFTALLSVLGWWGWTASFVMLRQVAARTELWNKASQHATGNRRHRPF